MSNPEAGRLSPSGGPTSDGGSWAAIGSVANLRLMFSLATDWSTISSLVTGAGTLVLAVATFAAVRSSNRSARIAELALQEQRRPVLAPSRLDDPVQKLMFATNTGSARPAVALPSSSSTAASISGSA